MRRERRQPTRREWAQITSSRPVVRRVIRKVALYEGRRIIRGAPLFLPSASNECSPTSEGGQS
jgi:hypothetical protein